MKDSVLSPVAPEQPQPVRGQFGTGSSGMRHSIRPLRKVTDQADFLPDAQPAAPAYAPMAKEAPNDLQVVDAPEAPRWQDLKLVEPGSERARSAAMPVVDQARDSAAVCAFNQLRTKLRQTTRQHGWKNIAVTAPTSGCGNTFTAVNLALSLSRITSSRTVLMDMNMRNPGVATAFDVRAPGPLNDYLNGGVAMTDHMVRCSDSLALGLNSDPDADASEILQDPATLRTLERMHAALCPDLVIYDMPPMLVYDDLSAFLPQLDGILVVSDGTQTTARQLTECEQMLGGQVPLIAVILNRARRSSVARYN